jgi:hypothetical protein
MIINTFSAFYYGHLITTDNQIIPFDEGFGEINAVVPVGSYTLESFADAVSVAMNDFGTLDYSVTVNRNGRFINIEASGNFTLLFGTSTQTEISCRLLLGFNLVNYTGSDNYTAPNPSGSEYRPQFKLQNFYDFELIRRPSASTVRTTSSGQVEVLKYGDVNFMRCTITYITNIVGQSVIRNNPQGVQDAVAFMNYITNKYKLEFVYDFENPETYESCILESSPGSSDGTGFELEPLYGRGLAGYYELRDLLFRRI